MIKLYDVINSEGTVVETLYSYEEAHEYVAQTDPTLTIVEREKSSVKPGFGRDPDLH